MTLRRLWEAARRLLRAFFYVDGVDLKEQRRCGRPGCPGAVRGGTGNYCCAACRSLHNTEKRIRNTSFVNEHTGRDQSVVDAKWDALQKVHEAMNEFRGFYA